MRVDLKNIEEIDNFLNNLMSEEEKKIFQTQAESNTEIQKNIQDQKDIKQVINRNAIKAEVQSYAASQKTRKRIIRFSIGGIIALLFIGFYLLSTN
jgi:hypothetical protein